MAVLSATVAQSCQHTFYLKSTLFSGTNTQASGSNMLYFEIYTDFLQKKGCSFQKSVRFWMRKCVGSCGPPQPDTDPAPAYFWQLGSVRVFLASSAAPLYTQRIAPVHACPQVEGCHSLCLSVVFSMLAHRWKDAILFVCLSSFPYKSQYSWAARSVFGVANLTQPHKPKTTPSNKQTHDSPRPGRPSVQCFRICALLSHLHTFSWFPSVCLLVRLPFLLFLRASSL